MILAAGLTPAWQQILVFDRLRIGHVNRAQSTLWCGSGKVLNVGAALYHLRADCLTLCPLGGPTGEQIRRDFADRGIRSRWVSTSASTRVCTTLIDVDAGTTTELVENSTALTAGELDLFMDEFSDQVRSASHLVLSGSLPQGTPVDFIHRLMSRASVPAILDIRGRELMSCLPLKPLLVKPNREELGMTLGRTLETDADLHEAMAEIRRLGAEWIVVSNGPGVVKVMGPGGLMVLKPPVVKTVNPIGCGDSLTAAIAARVSAGDEMLAAIQYGMEYAARKAGILYPVLQGEL